MSNAPALFVPHGSPMFALHPGAAGAALASLARGLARPRVIVVISPHWETTIPTVGAASTLPTLHDFSGFDRRLYDLRYPATGCPGAAQEVLAALRAAGMRAAVDESRGLDHGAWVPLRHLFPDADVPIVPLSIQHHEGPAFAYAVGSALAPLLEKGFMVVGSGNVTHNLDDWHTAMTGGSVDVDYVKQFADWIEQRIETQQIDQLLNYRQLAPTGARAHPRDEHLLPLFTALGAGGHGAKGAAFYRGISEFVLAMDGYLIRPGEST